MPITKVYVGGPTQSGKSTLAKHISWTTGLLAIELDCDRWITFARRRFNFERRTPLQRWRTIQMLRASQSSFVAEGIYLSPQDVSRHLCGNPNVLALFVGYPEISVTDKKHLIHRNGFRNSSYLKRLSDADLEQRLHNGIRISQTQRAACTDYGIPYFDLSDVTRLRESQEAAAVWVQRRLEQDKNARP